MVDFLQLHEDLWSLFPSKDTYPKANIHMRRDVNGSTIVDCCIDLVIPYHSKDQICIDINEDSQTIFIQGTGLKSRPAMGMDKDYLLQEIPQGSFRRSFRINGPLDFREEKINADLSNGVLRIIIPVKEKHLDIKNRRITLK